MYELVQVNQSSYYINCPAKIGVYTPDGRHVVLIDSGNDKDAGRKVRQLLEKQNWELTAILNTHSNADHIGGNQYLQSQTGCPIYANGMETVFTRYPLLESSFLYGGYPCKDLRHKFLMAQGSEVRDITDAGFPAEIEVIPLPGHFFDMVGFRTPDQTVYLADCLSSEATLAKYGIPFIYDVEAYLATLTMVESMQAKVFVPAHAEATADIRALAAFNREHALRIAQQLLETCKTPVTFEGALKAMFERYDLTMSFEQYVLVGSTVRSYLAWFKDTDKVRVDFSNHQLTWEAV